MPKIKMLALINANGEEKLSVRTEDLSTIDPQMLSNISTAIKIILDQKSNTVVIELERSILHVERLDELNSLVLITTEVDQELLTRIKNEYYALKNDMAKLKKIWESIIFEKNGFTQALEDMWG